MEQMLEKWNSFLQEARESYHFVVDIIAEPETQLYGSIFNKIRAIPGVTIVKTLSSTKNNEVGNKVSRLDIKFLLDPLTPGSKSYLDKVRNEIKTMKDAQGDRVLSVKIVSYPQKTSKDK